MVKLGGKQAKSMTYIPFTYDYGRHYFEKTKKRYAKFGVTKFQYFPVDVNFLKKEMRQALKSDIVYLAGGNTFYFLRHLRQSGMLKELKKFVERGGILAGLSAGALVMTPNIWMAKWPPHEADANEVRLKNLKALNLVNFEFLPHYTNSPKTNRAMIWHSKKSKFPTMACPDGSGIIIDGDQVSLFGPVYIFVDGRKTRIA